MPHVVQQVEGEVDHRFIFELRYEGGELFFDRSGRVARALAAKKGWAVQSVDLNGCHIWKEDENLIFTYSPARLSLTQSQNRDVPQLLPHGEFAAIAEEFSEAVVQNLEVNYFPRMGFRLLTLYGTESIEGASSQISRMPFFSPCKALSDLGELSCLTHGVVVARPAHMVRVAAMPFEQQVRLAPSVTAAAREEPHKLGKLQHRALIQKMKARKAIKTYPAAGVMIDMDAYIEDALYPDQITARTFIEEAMTDFGIIREAIFVGKEQP